MCARDTRCGGKAASCRGKAAHGKAAYNLVNLIFAKWCSIIVNVRFLPIISLRYVTFSSVRAVFGQPLPGFHFVADPCSSAHLQSAFTEQSFQPFSGNFGTIVWYPKPSFHSVSIRTLSLYDILLIQSYRPNCDHDLKCWKFIIMLCCM